MTLKGAIIRTVQLVSWPIGLKGAKSEQITINVGYVDLGHIDLIVDEGFYSNRTDFSKRTCGEEKGTTLIKQA